MNKRQKKSLLFVAPAAGIITGFVLGFSLLTPPSKNQIAMVSPVSSVELKDFTGSVKGISIAAADSHTFNKPVSVLLLGFDGRKGDKNPRCDAIHMISYLPEEGKIRLTNVPRGTSVNMPSEGTGSAYLANSCHTMGIDFAVSKIEKITGTKADYLVKVNFSQTLGILRILGFPTTPTLQFLRNRRYLIGDNQRSHNQALFIKDMVKNHLTQFSSLPKPIKYLIYNMVETDIDYEVADSLLTQIVQSNILSDSSNFELATKPEPRFQIADIHYQEEDFQNLEEWQSEGDYKMYQENLETYLQNLIDRAQKYQDAGRADYVYQLLKTPFAQQLWLQVENQDKRNQFHFNLLKYYIFGSPDREKSAKLVLDFETEMETIGQAEFKQNAEKLMDLLRV